MPQAKNDDVVLEFQTFGDAADPTLLLIMGFTAQMTAWPTEFCEELANRGLHVVRFDNRDCGLSSKTEGESPDLMNIMMSAMSGNPITGYIPYSLSDMAADAIAVLDELNVTSAHVAGASMGGMIAQMMAIEHPERVRSLTSIMSSTGARDVGQAKPAAMTALITPPPTERAAAIERGVELGRAISGPLFDAQIAREAATFAYDRSFYPAGAAFQLAAIAKTGDRTALLKDVTARALVIHGVADPLITPSGGTATAEALPNAELLLLNDMGHDLPRPLWDTIVGAIHQHVAASVACS